MTCAELMAPTGLWVWVDGHADARELGRAGVSVLHEIDSLGRSGLPPG